VTGNLTSLPQTQNLTPGYPSIVLSKEEAPGSWQRGMAYKGFSPSLKSLNGVDVEAIPSVQEQPVQSVVLGPLEVTAGETATLSGYAYSGGGRGIVRVDVSTDKGHTWKQATLGDGSHQDLDKAWAWTFWELDYEVPDICGSIDVVCKATDSSYNVQPDSVKGAYIHHRDLPRTVCFLSLVYRYLEFAWN
jgi:sulfite oxidase